MTQPTSYELRVKEFLSEMTDHLLEDEADIPELAALHGIPTHEAYKFAQMVEHLEHTLLPVSPDPAFKKQLRAELFGAPPQTLFGRLRNLPPRLQFAAGLALVAAMALLGRKRFLGEARRMWQQLPSNRADAAEINISTH